MTTNVRVQRQGRSTERTYSPERLKELVMLADQAAKQGTQRMDEREKKFKLAKG